MSLLALGVFAMGRLDLGQFRSDSTNRYDAMRCPEPGRTTRYGASGGDVPYRQWETPEKNCIRRSATELWGRVDARFNSSNYAGEDTFAAFVASLHAFKPRYDNDIAIEGWRTAENQKMNTVKWFWGHHLRFGADLPAKGPTRRFEVWDHMGDKWVQDLVDFRCGFGFDWSHFVAAQVLDVGVWTGATSYALTALNVKEILSVEEAQKYGRFAQYVAASYRLPMQLLNTSLYNLEQPALAGKFDLVYFPGVLYHLSDPFCALRILRNRLKVGGLILVETMGVQESAHGESNMRYQGISGKKNNHYSHTRSSLELQLREVGFEHVQSKLLGIRLKAVGRRAGNADFKRAGSARQDLC